MKTQNDRYDRRNSFTSWHQKQRERKAAYLDHMKDVVDQLVMPYMSYAEIAKKLNDENYKTVKGKSFIPMSAWLLMKDLGLRSGNPIGTTAMSDHPEGKTKCSRDGVDADVPVSSDSETLNTMKRVSHRADEYISQMADQSEKYKDWLRSMQVITSPLWEKELDTKDAIKILNSLNIKDFNGYPFNPLSLERLINELRTQA